MRFRRRKRTEHERQVALEAADLRKEMEQNAARHRLLELAKQPLGRTHVYGRATPRS